MSDERRAHERHAANLQTTCHLVNSDGPGYTVRVRDVSRGGINFLIEREIAPGTLVRIDLPRPAGGGESRPLPPPPQPIRSRWAAKSRRHCWHKVPRN